MYLQDHHLQKAFPDTVGKNIHTMIQDVGCNVQNILCIFLCRKCNETVFGGKTERFESEEENRGAYADNKARDEKVSRDIQRMISL